MKIIDVDTWKRKEQYHFYKDLDQPQYNVCLNLDITHFLQVVKERKLPFYYVFMFVAIQAMNEIEEFRYRIHDDQIVLYDQLHPSFTDIIEGTENFRIVTIDMKKDLFDFIRVAKESSIKQGDQFIDLSKEIRDDLVYISCLPWISFTSITHAMNLNKQDAIPRLTWGKYITKNDQVLLPLSISVHHAFVDGFTLGKYVQNLQERINVFK